jgi:hypothetical protein
MSQGKLEIAWRVSVGDALSRAARVRLLPDGSVEVHPADQRWSPELKRSSNVILSRLKALLGSDTITRISVIGGPEEKPRNTLAKVRETGKPAPA